MSVFSLAQSTETVEIESVHMVEELVIGDPASEAEYILGSIHDIAVDDESNIYIADEDAMEIKMFSKEGVFNRTIGRRGRGPGEFLSIGEAATVNGDNLLVVDERGFKITRFSSQGEVLDTYSMSEKRQATAFIRQIIQLADKNYLVLYKRFGRVGNEDEIFHIWDQKFGNNIDNFGSFRQLGYEEGFATEFAKVSVGSFFTRDDRQLLFAPALYEGEIYLYKELDGEWKFRKKVAGHDPPGPSYEAFEPNTKDGMRIRTQHGEFRGSVYVSSSGIFSLDSGYVVHFSMTRDLESSDDTDKVWKLGVELFDKDLNYLGYFPMNWYRYNPGFMSTGIKDKDQDDNFYMLDSVDGYPVVRKFSLDIQEK